MATIDDFKEKAVAVKKPVGFPEMLKVFLPEIQRALPKHLSGDRMARIALTAFRMNPKLAECDPRSVFACVIQASQLGLEPNMMGRSYLIPYGHECTFVPGWRGLVDLVNRSGQASVWTGAVFEGDKFEYGFGDTPFVKHTPMGEDEPDKLTHVYAIGRVKGCEWPNIEVWTMGKVIKHLNRYNKVGKRHYAWQNMEMYARKVALLQVLKYMPCSADLVAAISLNDAAEVGEQNLSVADAVAGTWTPPENDDATDVAYKEGLQGAQDANVATGSGKVENSAPAPASQGGGDSVTLSDVTQKLIKAFRRTTDIDVLQADATLIETLPEAEQEDARAVYIERLEALGVK